MCLTPVLFETLLWYVVNLVFYPCIILDVAWRHKGSHPMIKHTRQSWMKNVEEEAGKKIIPSVTFLRSLDLFPSYLFDFNIKAKYLFDCPAEETSVFCYSMKYESRHYGRVLNCKKHFDCLQIFWMNFLLLGNCSRLLGWLLGWFHAIESVQHRRWD